MKFRTSKVLNIKNTFFVIAVFVFLFLGLKVLAEECPVIECLNQCVKPPGWNKAGTCNVEICYKDPSPGSGLETCWYRAGGGAWSSACACSGLPSQTCCAPMTIGAGQACQAEGINACRVEAYAIDIAGNIGATDFQDYNIDYTPPTTTIDPNGKDCVNYDVSFTLTCTDNASGCDITEYKIIDAGATCDDTGLTSGTSGTVTCSSGQVCQKKVCFRSKDKAGNIESIKPSNIFKIDKKNPYLVSWNPTSRDWANTDVSVTVQYADDDCGMKETKYCWTTGASCSPTTLFPNSWGGTATQSNTGSWTLCVTATDKANNSVTECKGLYKIDKEKPVTTITSPAAGSCQGPPSFSVSISDSDTGGSGLNTAECKYRVISYDGLGGYTITKDNWPRTCNSSVTLSVGPTGDCRNEGTNLCRIVAWSKDIAGNTSDNAIRDFTIDWTAPTVSISGAPATWQNTDATASVSCSDALCGCNTTSYKLKIYTTNPGTCPTNYADYTLASPQTISSHSWVCGAAKDVAGNTGFSAPVEFKIDKTSPTVLVTGAPASWQNSDATASVSCSDADSGCDSATYKLKTYATNPVTCSTTYADYTLTSPQTISSHLWVCGAAKDVAGNTGFSSPVEFKVDKIKPVSQITAPEAGSTQTANFNVTVSDTDTGDSGINTGACYYRTYDSGVGWTRPWTLRTCNANQLITVGAGMDCQTENGTCTVYVYSYDNAGNQSEINLRSFLIRIDITPPTITINTPTGLWYNSNPLLDVDFADDKALDDGFYQVDSYTGAWTAIFTDNTGTSYTTDFKILDATWNGFADGSSHTIYFKATDDAGNVTGADGSKSLVIKKDVSAPTVTVTGAPASWQNTDATASLSCTDTNSGCDATTYKLKTYAANPGTCSTTYADYTLAPPQTISSHLWVCGAAKDNVGNAGFSSPVEFKVDKTSPTVSVTGAPASWQNTDATANVSCTDADSGCDSATYKLKTYATNPVTCSTTYADYTLASPQTISSHLWVCGAAKDVAGNPGFSSPVEFKVEKDAPSVSVTGAPASWQNTDATASLSCTDTNSGCDATTYKLKTYAANPGTCSTTYADYTLAPPQTISSHLWVCGAAKDIAGNPGFSSPVEFKVDKTKPVSLITAPDAGSTQTADFNVTVSDTDTGDSGINTGACYYRTYDSGVGWTRPWTLRTCNANQLITVGAGMDCQTVGGTCSVYVYSYDNAGNQSDINLRSFTIESVTCSVSVPDTGLINQWILINVSGSKGAIATVRFSSDNNLNGSPDGIWDGPYDWNTSSGNWDATNETMKWSFASAGNYEVWAELKDSGGSTVSCHAPNTILIMECYPGQTKTCTSPQGCSHTITCQPIDGTWKWPSCPSDVCTANTQDSILCPCPGIDGCVGNDYYDYPPYGDCNSYCSCDVGTSPGQPCAPTIYPNDPRCVGVDQCNSDADCEDGNPCTNNWCENPAASNSVCHRDNLAAGTSCGTCKQCDGNGNCINRPEGYDTGECGAGCQRCLYGSCQDYNLACAGTEASCECRSDSCIDCSNYYDGGCGYQGICFCGPSEKPVWSCSNWQCSCICQYDASCEWTPSPYPEVIFSPPSQEGNPGQELSYNVTITNPTENEETYTISGSVPSGWSYLVSPQTVTIGAGQSTNVSFKVTPPANAPSGEYDVSVIAQNTNRGEGFGKYVIPNQPPIKPTPSGEYPGGVSWDHCSVQALSLPTFHWNYSDPEGNPQQSYQIQIDDDNPETPPFTDSKDSSSPSYTPSTIQWKDWMSWNTNYWWTVKVKDNQGNWSDWSSPTLFTTPLHAGPWPDFSLSKERVAQNEVVTAIDISKCYTFPGNTEVNCRDLVGTSYEWDFNYIEPTFTVDKTTKGNTNWVYSERGFYKVKLRIEDDIAKCLSDKTGTVTVTLPLPRWWEIPPF